MATLIIKNNHYHFNYINLNKIKEIASGSEKIMKDKHVQRSYDGKIKEYFNFKEPNCRLAHRGGV